MRTNLEIVEETNSLVADGACRIVLLETRSLQPESRKSVSLQRRADIEGKVDVLLLTNLTYVERESFISVIAQLTGDEGQPHFNVKH